MPEGVGGLVGEGGRENRSKGRGRKQEGKIGFKLEIQPRKQRDRNYHYVLDMPLIHVKLETNVAKVSMQDT